MAAWHISRLRPTLISCDSEEIVAQLYGVTHTYLSIHLDVRAKDCMVV